MGKRTDWQTVLPQAATIAASYSPPPTLRQVFYRLVAAGLIPNTQSAYQSLARNSATARRAGTFPGLTDGTRRINQSETFTSPQDGINQLASWYRIDRTEGQEAQVWIIVEKATLEALAMSVADPFGIPVVALRGYGSQTIKDSISDAMQNDGRSVEILYLGDFDPTGEDIIRDLVDRLAVPVNLTRVAVTAEQVAEFSLAPMPGKTADPRASTFMAKHGTLVQVEVEAIPPDVLIDMISLFVNRLTNSEVHTRVMQREGLQRQRLERLTL